MASSRLLDCLVAGEANVDLLIGGKKRIEERKERLATHMELLLGGSSAIMAFNLSRLGAKVGFIGVLGRDMFGKFVEERLRSAGVQTNRIQWSGKEKTGITIWYSSGGERAGLTYPGTITTLKADDVREQDLRKARHFHVGHYFLLKSFHAGAADLFRSAKQFGLTTSLDCNYDPTERWNSRIHQVLRYTDVFFPNEEEALRLTNCSTVKSAAKELARRAGVVAVKLGPRGALICKASECFHVPGRKVRAVDTTGAGDSFNAGFLSHFLRGADLHDCARAGVEAGARCVTRVGGVTAFEEK